MFVNITGNVNAGETTTTVEVLRNTSSLVNYSAPGKVYKNVNIWVGTSGFAVPANIKDAIIRFKVENTWLDSNNLAASEVKMMKWDGNEWVQLETTLKEKDNTNTYLEAKTDRFSPLAITGLKGKGGEAPFAVPTIAVTETTAATTLTQGKAKGTPGFEVIVAITTLSAVYMFWRKRK